MFKVFAGAHILAISALLSAALPAQGAESVLDRVKRTGVVRCGIDKTPGFGGADAAGRPAGFDVDFCRAVAAATLGNGDAIATQRISTANKFKALADGEIDIAFGMTTWTFTRDTALGTLFPAITFYDGQGFMVWSDQNVNTLGDLAGKTVCVQAGTTSAANLEEMLARMDGAAINVLKASTSDEKMAGFAQRRCDAVTGDRSELASRRATLAPDGKAWKILDETISREPLGPVVAQGDAAWFGIVRWVVHATILAEAKGLSSANIDTFETARDGEIRRLAGLDPQFGAQLGLDPRWTRRIIAQIGNYGEIFSRNLGANSSIGLERGSNNLWTNKGLHYPAALR